MVVPQNCSTFRQFHQRCFPHLACSPPHLLPLKKSSWWKICTNLPQKRGPKRERNACKITTTPHTDYDEMVPKCVCVTSGSKPCHNHISQSASLVVGGVAVVGKLSQAKPLDFGQLYLTLHNSTRNSTQNSPHDSCWRIRGTAVFRAVQRRWPSDSWLQPVRCVTPQQRWWCAFFFSFQRSTSSSNSSSPSC